MAESTGKDPKLDLSYIEDPNLRRALREIHDRAMIMLTRQERDIQALLEMVLDYRIGSIGEFKRYLAKQEDPAHAGRIHDAIMSAVQPKPAGRA